MKSNFATSGYGFFSTITAIDVFGKEISRTVTFESDKIPTGGGTDVGQGDGTVSLSAIATSPDGSDVTTTFREAEATVADGGFQGVVAKLPTTLEFEHTEAAPMTGSAMPSDGTGTRYWSRQVQRSAQSAAILPTMQSRFRHASLPPTSPASPRDSDSRPRRPR